MNDEGSLARTRLSSVESSLQLLGLTKSVMCSSCSRESATLFPYG